MKSPSLRSPRVATDESLLHPDRWYPPHAGSHVSYSRRLVPCRIGRHRNRIATDAKSIGHLSSRGTADRMLATRFSHHSKARHDDNSPLLGPFSIAIDWADLIKLTEGEIALTHLIKSVFGTIEHHIYRDIVGESVQLSGFP